METVTREKEGKGEGGEDKEDRKDTKEMENEGKNEKVWEEKLSQGKEEEEVH